ncbi:DNA polymerase III subunit gamma/tau [Salsuginibacillus kocurii]|uniref:DNA polymerase III subunit gamma/tau n=1 Tax=Salsuginibacillus kocurii TaxID=427078 RepID=UPI00037C4AE9|nr:DNA polymerase III subunit gamma/tau [Salsuginibacillus kocurii]
MAYQALYRVWRPKNLEDVVGQSHITRTLQNSLQQEKFSHAYLFSGPRGTGKTSAAKIMAKAINCKRAPVSEPCHECEACKGISDGSIVDVVEIDAASNNGVDEIRYIREHVMASPRDVRYKVYIIDEVHMLSTGAFNALLKTLEEPPGHVMFILATTEPHKIPLTIASRCQRFDFKRISAEDLIERMRYILHEQGIDAEEEALQLISRAAEGGMRDALSLLDQASSFAEKTVTANDILAITGAVSQSFLGETIQALSTKDSAKAIQAADQLIRDGKDPLRFMEDIIYYLRDLLLYRTAPELNQILDRASVDDSFKALAEDITPSWLYEVIDILNKYHRDMKGSSHPKIYLELAFIHLSNHEKNNESSVAPGAEQGANHEELLQKIQHLEKEVERIKSDTSANTNVQSKQAPKPPARPERTPQPAMSSASMQKIEHLLEKASKQSLQELTSQWAEVMNLVKKESVPGHAWVSDSKPVAAFNEGLLLAFQNEMHRNMVDTKFRATVESAVEQVMKRPMQVFTLIEPEWEKIKSQYRERMEKEQPSLQEEAPPGDPIVDEAVKLVGEELIDVKEHN